MCSHPRSDSYCDSMTSHAVQMICPYQMEATGSVTLLLEIARQMVEMVSSGQKSGDEAARLFRVHPSTVTRLMASSGRMSCSDEH